jgi:hypothetical protein
MAAHKALSVFAHTSGHQLLDERYGKGCFERFVGYGQPEGLAGGVHGGVLAVLGLAFV